MVIIQKTLTFKKNTYLFVAMLSYRSVDILLLVVCPSGPNIHEPVKMNSHLVLMSTLIITSQWMVVQQHANDKSLTTGPVNSPDRT